MRARTLEELIDVGLLLDRQPAPAGRRVALIGNAGGPLILGADAADAAGLEVPLLSAASDEVSRLAPGCVHRQPDRSRLWRHPGPAGRVVHVVGTSGEVDACLVVCVDLGEAASSNTSGRCSARVELDGVPLALSLIGTGDSGVGVGAAVPDT